MKLLEGAPEELIECVNKKYGEDCYVFDMVAETFEEFQLLEELEHNCDAFMRIGSERFRFIIKRIKKEDQICWACTLKRSIWIEVDE